jgi:hypothetical protein
MTMPRDGSRRNSTAARPRSTFLSRIRGGGTDGNELLTTVTGMILIVLLAVIGVTIPDLRGLISVHLAPMPASPRSIPLRRARGNGARRHRPSIHRGPFRGDLRVKAADLPQGATRRGGYTRGGRIGSPLSIEGAG